ncbi:RNA polymerase sigma factor [Paenibacillus lupini]|uniref:sigma-70 family RNA polymerase sigma factor n=1 Tax=Paenibacillus lupini TaxID=1450204 RepID=UPI00141D80CD|nr:RNA polymerase sigma-70 factor (ECF subfamily) [Paenibacillus lupini]
MSGPNDKLEEIYENYYKKIYRFLALKVDIQTAEDVTQLTFVKAMENWDTFRGDASVFTWLCHIANNTLKNEFRKKHRTLESSMDLLDQENQFITLEFTKNVELRIDVTRALIQLSPLDRQIISLHYDVGCTFKEIAELVGMRMSAVKNRLYRAIARLRTELYNWEAQKMLSIIDSISIVSKNVESKVNLKTDTQIYQDIIEHLRVHVDRICTELQHQPTNPLTIEIYPDLYTFHQAVLEPDAPNWFMGMIEENTIKITSPLNPGPEHTYSSILKSTLHLFTIWLVKDINPAAPKWLYQGIGGFEAGLMTREYINDSILELVRCGEVPTFEELEDNTWDFDTKKGFQFSYLLCEFILKRYGQESLNKIIRTPTDFVQVFSNSAQGFHNQWVTNVRHELNLE